MEKQGIIVKESQPTEWISSLVAVQKPGKLRVCIDPRDLNRAIKRPKVSDADSGRSVNQSCQKQKYLQH